MNVLQKLPALNKETANQMNAPSSVVEDMSVNLQPCYLPSPIENASMQQHSGHEVVRQLNMKPEVIQQFPPDNVQIFHGQTFQNQNCIPITQLSPGTLQEPVMDSVLPTVQFGWYWHDPTDVHFVLKETQGNWHFDPVKCKNEAMLFKPKNSQYKLQVTERLHLITIGKEMFDGAYAHLIIQNAELWRSMDDNVLTNTMNPVEVYGEQIKQHMKEYELYGLSRKAITHYLRGLQADVEIWFMKQYSEYEENNIIQMILQRKINPQFLELFSYLYSLG